MCNRWIEIVTRVSVDIGTQYSKSPTITRTDMHERAYMHSSKKGDDDDDGDSVVHVVIVSFKLHTIRFSHRLTRRPYFSRPMLALHLQVPLREFGQFL